MLYLFYQIGNQIGIDGSNMLYLFYQIGIDGCLEVAKKKKNLDLHVQCDSKKETTFILI